MGKFHSILSRRDFMKAIGLGTVGATTIGVASPVFSSFDDMMAAGAGADPSLKRPWYVKQLELGHPTIEVEWSQIKRMENRYQLNATFGQNYTYGDQRPVMSASGTATLRKSVQDKRAGYSREDFALAAGAANPDISMLWSLPGPLSGHADLAPYNASNPERNSQILRAALTFFGASFVGFAPFHGEEMNFANASNDDNLPYRYDSNIDWATYTNGVEAVVPTKKPLYAVGVLLQMSKEIYRHESTNEYSNGEMYTAANSDRYRRWPAVYRSAQRFLATLGYNCFGYFGVATRSFLPAVGDAILTGAGEAARNSNFTISPDFGPVVGGFSLVTDFPLAPNGPIDAGIFKFCRTCAKCAKYCPSNSITEDKEPVWSDVHLDASKYKYGKDNPVRLVTAGKKNFFWDASTCRWQWGAVGRCCNCMGTCTFNGNDGAGIHGMVKATLATTSLFNGFFAQADEFYGFGLTSPDKVGSWWDMKLPIAGFNSNYFASDGAYRKRAY